jgi:hypothetical protein
MADVIFVRGMTKHRVVRAEPIRLPRGNGDRDLTADFDAPGMSSSGGAHSRPVLFYLVEPGEEQPVRVKISINGTNLVDRTLSAPVSGTFTQVVEHGVVDREDNELRVFVPADPQGSVVVSNLILVYSADQEISLPDPDTPPPSGNGF